VRRLWWVIAAVCSAAAIGGYAIADATSGDLQAAINGFAAGVLLVMPRPR
jgi:zinc transporter, ZIP family